MSLQRLVITCGGTGGHFFPGLSIAREFQKQGGDVLLLLSGQNPAAQRDIAIASGVDAIALPQMPGLRKNPLRYMWGLTGGFFVAMRQLHRFKPQALLGMGSFAMSPLIAAAFVLRIPLFLHDGNARIGKANRIASCIARVVGTGFPAVNGKKCRCPVVHCGMPVRPELRRYANLSKAGAVAALNEKFACGFDPELPTLLVTGGSQGAAIFNTVIPQVLCCRSEKFQLIHLTGKGKLSETVALYRDASFPRVVVETLSAMELALGAADLVFSRSGGSTAAELALFGSAVVLVPFPYAAEGHQTDNAAWFAGNAAAVMVANEKFTGEKVAELLDDFFRDKEKWHRMGEKIRTLAVPDAAERMLAEISRKIC